MARPSPAGEVARVVTTKRRWLGTASAGAVLATLGAAALAPIAIVVAGGGALPAAVAGVAGNVGAGYLEDLVRRAADRLRRKELTAGDDLRTEIERELLDRLDGRGEDVSRIGMQVLRVLEDIGDLDRALSGVGDDLRATLDRRFGEVARGQLRAGAALGRIEDRQRRQARDLRRQGGEVAELVDRVRRWERSAPTPPAATPQAPAVGAVVVTRASVPAPPTGWVGGMELTVGATGYLLLDDMLGESRSADRSIVRREGRALRIVPRGRPDTRHVWVRQVEATPDAPSGTDTELRRERDLVRALGADRILPVVDHAQCAGVGTLVLAWPASPDGTTAGTLADWLRDGVPLDASRRDVLFSGLASVCDALATLHDHGTAHRELAPAGIVLDSGRLRLRDTGAAARRGRQPVPPPYAAPEQRGGAPGDGSSVDAYQVAALAHHLLTGGPPHPRAPLPLNARTSGMSPEVARVLDACLRADPAARPDLRTVASVLRGHRTAGRGGR